MFDSQIPTKTQISEDIHPSQAHTLITETKDGRDLVMLDVCTPKEFARLHLENAVNLDFFSRGIKDQLSALDKNKTYLVYCKMGGRSKLAQRLMKKLGFREVYNIVGGTLLWAEEGLPFAPGVQRPPQFSLCPMSISITLTRRIKKFFQTGYRQLVNVARADVLRKTFRYRPEN